MDKEKYHIVDEYEALKGKEEKTLADEAVLNFFDKLYEADEADETKEAA